MGFTLVFVPPHQDETETWPQRLAEAVPGLRVLRPDTETEAAEALREADAAYGALPEELLAHAGQLRWLQAPQAGPPPGFYHPKLIEHPVQITNMRDTYTDHVATHTMALVLALARGLPQYVRAQIRSDWAPDWDPGSVLALAESSALIVGVGAIGNEVGRMLSAFGTRVVGVDARQTDPVPGFAEILPASALDDQLGQADLVIITVPHTPETEGMFDASRLARLRGNAFLVNIGRGPTLRLDALDDALAAGRLAGAALDVFETEPLPSDHPLWTRENVLITPHVAGAGPHATERRFAVTVENARRFASGEPLINVVDKARWH
ncbi:D-2-hydroxyacid dehydrogenase [Kibdelosporangium philippinense]|uniref:D-2-hydroxyacid dehydrogenase n=1 Tax=Kibdelosporangium philippinense TaxID=211113 RepID=A0ABS8Z7X4_9PSEU|nr:D-2-hydroxyacid dehydrogenase [Kibdelosporangium philippinense]MCE7002673.1 D-2-hydroxyacid dehydrogenase [Kibdelosporangium philippinense]